MNFQKVSVITPTYNRENFLNKLYECYISQKYPNIEWLILDNSDKENFFFKNINSDNSIRYIYNKEILTIGEKRNKLIELSSGDIIVHFDDDDYYSPTYISDRINHLEVNNSHISLLNGFFVYHLELKILGYYQTMIKEGLAFKFSRKGIKPVELKTLNIPFIHWCFGFSYVYKKNVWLNAPFENINVFEDRNFLMNASRRFNVSSLTDHDMITIHNAHSKSSSQTFPQNIIPNFLINKINNQANRYLNEIIANRLPP